MLQVENLDPPKDPANQCSISVEDADLRNGPGQFSGISARNPNFFKKKTDPIKYVSENRRNLNWHRQKPITKNENYFKEPSPDISGEKHFETSDGNLPSQFLPSSNALPSPSPLTAEIRSPLEALSDKRYLSNSEIPQEFDRSQSKLSDAKSNSIMQTSLIPFSVRSEVYKPHELPRGQEIVGFYFNQHLEFGDESSYSGNSSCFMFKFRNNRIEVFKPLPGRWKYFRVSSQGIFIGESREGVDRRR